MIIDITQELFSCRLFPGDPGPVMTRSRSMDDGEMYNLTDISMCVHNGTHVDAPFHFINDAKTIDEISLSAFVGDCFVVRHEGDVTEDDVVEIMERAREADSSTRILIAGDATVTLSAAEAFAQSGIKLLGNESQTVGPVDSPRDVHLTLLGAGIVLLEGIVLTDVAEGRYFLSAAPLKLGGCDGAPCRAYLMS